MPILSSFRWRLAAMLLGILFVTTGMFFVLSYQIDKQILTNQVLQHARVMGKSVRLEVSRLLRDTGLQTFSDLSEEQRQEVRTLIQHFNEGETELELYGKGQDIRDLFFIDAGGRVLIDTPSAAEGRTLPPAERIGEEALAAMMRNEIDTRIETRGRDTLVLTTFPAFLGDRLLGFGRIELSMNPIVALLNRITRWGLATALGLFLVGVLLAGYVAKSVTTPVGELVQAATRIGRGDFGERLDESRRDEIGLLMRAFNQMADNIVKLEETQRRVRKLEIGGQLGALVAHEIKNPLNSIGLIIDHMRDHFSPDAGPDRERFRELTTNVRREVDRLNTIVEGFLRSARPTSPSPQLTDLNALLEETLHSLAPEATGQHITLVRQLDPDIPRIALDYQQLRQAVVNLLVNAIQSMPQGGELRLITRLQGDEVLIAVRDSGAGIPREHLGRLFDPYFTTKQRGFGLGLAIVEQTVKAHGGRVTVDSAVGGGSTFTIHLPTVKDAAYV